MADSSVARARCLLSHARARVWENEENEERLGCANAPGPWDRSLAAAVECAAAGASGVDLRLSIGLS